MRGFTLPELLVVLLVIAILSGVAITMLARPQAQEALEGGARRVAADVAYAQAKAVTHGEARWVVFEPDSARYSLRDAGGAVIPHPIAKTDYVVEIGQLHPNIRLSLSEVAFAGSDTLRFDRHGVPAAGGELTVSGSAGQWTVAVSPGTGRVVITELGDITSHPF